MKADARACDREAGVQRGPLTAKFKKCMLRHHWTLSHVVRTAPSPAVGHNRSSFDSSNDDMVRQQQEQNNIQQMIINQQSFDNQQQMLNNQ